MELRVKFLILILAVYIGLCTSQSAAPVCADQVAGSPYYIHEDYCAWEYVSGLDTPRQLYVADNGDILVGSKSGSITVLFDSNKNGVIEASEHSVLATVTGLNHAVTVYGDYLYATSASTVYRWRYTPGNRTNLGNPTVVLKGMPTGGHSTRTLAMQGNLQFYVSIGSNNNVDPDSSRSRVYYCDASTGNLPITLSNCIVQADGNRNEVGLRFDPTGRLWGVENGMDSLSRPDLVADAHITNPCEEVNLFDSRGSFYGYPRCWSEGYLPPAVSNGSGSNHGLIKEDDEWCINESNVVRPKFCMPAHTAPLDLLFWNSSTFQPPFNKGLIVALHGSWNRQPSSGYQVVHIEIDSNYNPVNATLTKFFGGVPNSKGDQWAFRPVSVARLAPCSDSIPECLLISSDDAGSVIAIRYKSGSPSTTTDTSTTTGTTTATTGTTTGPSTTSNSTKPIILTTYVILMVLLLSILLI